MPHKIWIESLGCAKNQVDSEVMLGLLGPAGFSRADGPGLADLIIVNTCGFIEAATEESIEVVLEMADVKKAPGPCRGLVVAGCLYQRYGENLIKEMPEVDAFIGCAELENIGRTCLGILGRDKSGKQDEARGAGPAAPGGYLYDHETPRVLLGGSASVYVKIAEGCDNRCAYCTIPSLRGNYRSRSIDSVVKETRGLIGRGAREINLIAQDTTYFGMPEGGEERLTELLRKLDGIRDKKWLRLMYAHPARITDAVARAISDSRSVCHYLDMPIQHASDAVLKAMGRKGGLSDIRRAMDTLRSELPDIAIRTTLLLGFPGESDAHFEELMDFVREARFDRLGAFKYSPEAGTTAAKLKGQVPQEVKEERYDILMREQSLISHELNSAYVGERMEVLLESMDEIDPGIIIGRTYRDAPEVDGHVRISFEGNPPTLGEFIHVEITGASEYDLEGKMP